jgi:hypothetical protein
MTLMNWCFIAPITNLICSKEFFMSDSQVGSVSESISAQASQHTEQALVELVYIQEANDLIGNTLGNLDNALNASQSVLNILQGLQNLHNDISVQSKSAFPFLFSTGRALAPGVSAGTPGSALSAGAYVTSYNTAASAYFGSPIDPNFVFTGPTDPAFITFANNLAAYKTSLQNEIRVISAITPADAKGAGSLYESLQTVLKDLPTDPHNFASAEAWALDNYNTTGTGAAQAGNVENDITTAITAAESLNDTQKENVRQFLFIFQEYYQSASAVLSSMNQLMEQMAQKISS